MVKYEIKSLLPDRELEGPAVATIYSPEPLRLSQLLERVARETDLLASVGESGDWHEQLLVMVNGRSARVGGQTDPQLSDGDRVSLLLPIAGGR